MNRTPSKRAQRAPRPAHRAGPARPAERPRLGALAAKDLMTPNPVSIRADASVKEAAAVLTDRGFGALPVIDEAGRPVGVLSRTDIVRYERERTDYRARGPVRADRGDRTMPEGEHLPEGFQIEDVDPTVVRDLMTPKVFTVTPDTRADGVALEMATLKVHRLFVTDAKGVLVGVVSASDIVRGLAFRIL